MRFRGVNLQTTLRLCHIQMKYDKVEEEEKNASQKTVHRLNVTHTETQCAMERKSRQLKTYK